MQLHAYGGARDSARADLRARGCWRRERALRGRERPHRRRTADALGGAGGVRLRAPRLPAARRRSPSSAEARAHHARPHLRDRLRAGSRGDARRPAAPAASSTRLSRGRSGTRFVAPARSSSFRVASRTWCSWSTAASGWPSARAGLGYDIRLACHGLDRDDNDFVVGLLGPELHPLSIIVQRMRKTKQTSLHLERLGPFFVGRVAWQSSP